MKKKKVYEKEEKKKKKLKSSLCMFLCLLGVGWDVAGGGGCWWCQFNTNNMRTMTQNKAFLVIL